MRPTLFNWSSTPKWFLLAIVGTFLVACNDHGRGPILGTDGNVALSPTVTAVTPANNATNVTVINPTITAQFSEPVNALTAADFTVTCASPCTTPSGTVTMNASNTMATFTVTDPAELSSSTVYTATIVNATSRSNGLSIAQPYVWSFTTAAAPVATLPRVSSTVPATSTSSEPTSNVVVNTVISAEFTKEMDADTITDATFIVTCVSPCVNPAGSVSYNMASKSAVFIPEDNLDWDTTYTVTIDSSVTDLDGNELAGNQGNATTVSDYIWQFTTGSLVDTTRPRVTITEPVTLSNGPTENVPANTAITAVFSESMLASTIDSQTFTLTCETPCVSPAGAVSYVSGSKSAVFTPEENLEEGTTYTATVFKEVTDLAGNQLAGNQGPVTSASDYIWTFTTVAAVPADNIFVLSTDPDDGDFMAVCPSASINATFEIPSGVRLNPTTVNDMTFIVVENDNPANSVIAESIMLDQDTGTIITFIPQEELPENVTYLVTIKGGPDGVKDLIVPGNEMLEDYEFTFTTEAPTESCLEPVDLGTAAPFGSFGGSAGVTNQGLLTMVNGDLGTTATSTLVTGFVSEPGCEYTITTLNEGQVNGKIFTAPPPPTVACPQDGTAVTEAIAIQARLDAEAAFIELSPANMPGGQNPGNDNLGSLTLTPGIYTAPNGSFRIQGGDLTLDAQGNQNAVWVFQMATTLTVGGPGADFPQSVVLTNGAQAKNIFWQVGSAATINAAGGGNMKGTIIAQDGVSISTAGNVDIVTLDGRALSLTASVTMVNTVINVPAE